MMKLRRVRRLVGSGAVAAFAIFPQADAATVTPIRETAVLGGGCFWGMEAVFEHVVGVQDVVSGYAGGSASDANYSAVSSERTGHAETVRITFDRRQISYAQLLAIYFTVAHDPTELDRQGPDRGHSYRSVIFPQSSSQAAVAKRSIEQLSGSSTFHGRIVTTIEKGQFYPAESVHQDFMRRHPDYPYVVVNDLPKLARLRERFPSLWRPGA